MADYLKATYELEEKKRLNLVNMKDFIDRLVAEKARLTDIDNKITAFDTAISVGGVEETAIRATQMCIDIIATYNNTKTAIETRISSLRDSVTNLDNTIQADGDYSAAEKTEVGTIKTNEVW